MNDRGSAAVEFALVLPVVLLLVLTMAEVVATARIQLELTHAAREGARVAATVPDPARAVDAVQSALSPGLVSDVGVHVVRPHVVGKAAEVVVTSRRRIAGKFFGGFAVELRAKAVMRVEQ